MEWFTGFTGTFLSLSCKIDVSKDGKIEIKKIKIKTKIEKMYAACSSTAKINNMNKTKISIG